MHYMYTTLLPKTKRLFCVMHENHTNIFSVGCYYTKYQIQLSLIAALSRCIDNGIACNYSYRLDTTSNLIQVMFLTLSECLDPFDPPTVKQESNTVKP